ncbi:MAG: glycosyltransferase [Kiritimatiellae bacterium]|nr:glycosyltransferase [Kiritimatiellia bacterium]MDD5522674.1 glycosyltransferase [Kiritimatiellia bacterium]
MKSVVLIPYCPLPADTGGKREMWKHLEILKALGECRIISAATKPVGAGWTPESRSEIEKMGYSVTLREESCNMSAAQLLGIGYAAICKALGLEKAFGHSNPYHRYAFPAEWWRKYTEDTDLVLINYSYWSWLPCACPKVVVLLDLWSDYMWEGARKEVEDLRSADLVVVISKEEEKRLNELGVSKTIWSPPSIQSELLPLTDSVGLIGSSSRFNIDGLKWIEEVWDKNEIKVRVYGGLADHVTCLNFVKVGGYVDSMQPYRECGIILAPTAEGMGVQIKTIEALAAGRAIVARKGAMRGLPSGDGAWIEVEKPGDMVEMVRVLKTDEKAKISLSDAARAYYSRHLDSDTIRKALYDAYMRLTQKSGCKS